jgi:hypothetical protein
MDENANDIEKEYLLGGESALAREMKVRNVEKDGLLGVNLESSSGTEDPSRVANASAVMFYANVLVFMFAAGLLGFLINAYSDFVRMNQSCPVVLTGMCICGFLMVNCLIGFLARFRAGRASKGPGSASAVETLYYTNHLLAFIGVQLVTLLAVASLLHWDIGGQPAHQLFHAPETVGVQYRFAIWGCALAAGLAMIVHLYGSLGRDWNDEDNIMRLTFRLANGVLFLIGSSLIALSVMIWYYREHISGENPWSVTGSAWAGAVLMSVAAVGMSVNQDRRKLLFAYLLMLPLVTVAVVGFSINNAIIAEPEKVSLRRTNTLFSALLGLWGQLTTIVALNAGHRWRHYLKLKPH